MISCPGLLADTEMAQRSNRRFLNLISVEVFQAVTLIRKRAGGIHHGQESLTPPKAEYIGAGAGSASRSAKNMSDASDRLEHQRVERIQISSWRKSANFPIL